MKSKKNEKGFTLIELLIVLVIMAIVAAIAVPMISGYTKAQQKKNCQTEMNALADEIRADLASQRFSESTALNQDVYNEIQSVCLNHIQGAAVSNEDETNYKSFNLTGICTSGGTYKVTWNVSTSDSSLTVSGFTISCDKQTDVSISEEIANEIASITIHVESPTISAEEYVKSVALSVYDKVADYVKDNTKVNKDNREEFLKSALGDLYTLNTSSGGPYGHGIKRYGIKENTNGGNEGRKENSLFNCNFTGNETYSISTSPIKPKYLVGQSDAIWGISIDSNGENSYTLCQLIYYANYSYDGKTFNTPILVKKDDNGNVVTETLSSKRGVSGKEIYEDTLKDGDYRSTIGWFFNQNQQDNHPFGQRW